MSEPSERFRAVLDGFARFLGSRDLAPAKHQPHLVRCCLLRDQRIRLLDRS